MKRKAAFKDFYMEIKRSPGRFLSLLFIVALGVAFFSGIRAAEPAMRITGDAYFDDANLMDIKALSTYGVTEEDIRAIEGLDGVERAEGAYSADFIHVAEDEPRVIHVMSYLADMNEIEVTEGRLPEKTGECLADNEAGYKVGDKIRLESGTDDPVTDTIKTDELTVVGLGSSPCYISYGRGSSTIGTGSVSAFLIVPEDTFDLDVYTEVYVKAEGAKELLAYGDGYETRIELMLDDIEDLAGERGRIRKQEITDDAEAELADAKAELEEGRAEAERELADALEQIEDGQSQLDDAKSQIKSGKSQIASAKKTLREKQAELDAGRAEYESGLKQYNDGLAAYEQGVAQLAAEEAQLKAREDELAAWRAELDGRWQQYQGFLQMIEGLEAQEPVPADPANPDEGFQKKYAEWKQQIGALQAQAQGAKAELDDGEAKYAQGMAAAAAARSQAEKQFAAAQSTLDASKAQLDASREQLSGAAAELTSGQAQIRAGWAELKKQEAALKSGETEIAENETKLADARREYEDGRAEAEAEIADGEQEIADAEADIAAIEEPDWYVYDRGTLTEYDGLGENAERVGAIGRVFPVLFFLVAALISLTSMTRMVEEQRTAIGTMKALGYGKFAIASKYLGYALLATAGGSVIGVLFGEKVLPYIIIYAYGILYRHIKVILTPYDWYYGAIGSFAAIACTTVATFAACYRELGAQPAVLMRPPSPKNGKRVFLERVRIIWSHLNFTWKSTVRNLLRYKKRFFMTVFGIGGCMALMLVGFGLRDSIYEIADIQYEEIQVYDGSFYLQEDLTEEDRAELAAFLDKDEDIDRYSDAYMKSVTLTGGGAERETVVCVIEDEKDIDQYVHFRDRVTKKEYALTDDGAIVSEKTAKLLNAKVGDSVYIKDEDTGNKEIKIAQICENYMHHFLYMTPGYYEKVYGEAPEYNSVLFAVPEEYTQAQMEKAGQKALSEDQVLSVSYMSDIERQLNDMLKSLNLVIVVLIISAGMLAFVVLYNLNNINIAERKRELATLKVLGFYDGEVAQYVYRENILLTFIGAAAGVVLGKFLHLFVIRTVEVEQVMFGRVINFPSYLYSLAFTVAFSLIVNGVMYFKLKKIDMVESLKSIE